jgi:hypothetical protein
LIFRINKKNEIKGIKKIKKIKKIKEIKEMKFRTKIINELQSIKRK